MNNYTNMSDSTDKATTAALNLQMDFIGKICERFEKQFPELMSPAKYSRSRMIMDLLSIAELNLPALLEANAQDFAHDVCGIIANMDRSTYPGTLTGLFWPRCAEPMR